MADQIHSAAELLEKTGCRSNRELRAWLRKHRIRCIDAPGGPIVPHEALLDALGLRREQNDPQHYDPASTI